jgi:hypothetical protein
MAPADPPTRLTIVVKESAESEPTEYILECDGATPGKASTLPEPGPACATVARLGVRFFTALPSKNMLCTQQYGGPQTARVSGTIDGEPVNAAFARTNGCEISRWDAAKGIVGPGGNF